MGFFDYITGPLGWILSTIYSLTKSYGLSIIFFTVVIRLLMLPLAIKQQKSMSEMQKIQPHLEELKKKHKNDQQKLNEETIKLYQEHKVNPAGGCLPLIIQIPIMLGLYNVITRPFTYIIWNGILPKMHDISNIMKKLSSEDTFNAFKAIASNPNIVSKTQNSEIGLLENFKNSAIIAQNNIVSFISERISAVDKSGVTFSQEQVKEFITKIQESDFISRIQHLDLRFLGLNLAEVPNFTTPNILWLIPLLAAATTFASSKLTMKTSSAQNQNEQAAQMQKNMMTIFPLMTLMFTFQFPAGLGLYWIVSNLVQMLQQLFLNKYFGVKKEGIVTK